MRQLNLWMMGLSLVLGIQTLAQEEETRSPDAIPTLSNTAPTAEKTATLPPGMVEKVIEGSTTVEGASQARRKIIDEVTFKASEQIVQTLLGAARYKKNKNIIVDKIFRQASRYIPVIKAGDLLKTPEGQKLTVTLQINTKVLETLLQEQGLLYDNESSPMMIPFVSIEDQVRGENYRWWKAQNPQHLHSLADYLETQLQKSLFGLGFYVQRPDASQMRHLLPIAYQQDLLTPEQVQNLATRWSIPLAMQGDLTLRKDPNGESVMDLRLSVIQVSTGRVLAQLYRQNKLARKETFETLNLKKNLAFVVQAYKDLGQQMLEAWQRGVLTSTLVRLELQGPLPINKYELFKEALKTSNRSIRQVRERLISSQGVLFELEINGAVGDITGSLSQVTAGDRVFRLKGLNPDNTLILIPVGSR